MRKVEAPKEFLDFMKEKDVCVSHRYTAMRELSSLFFDTKVGTSPALKFLVDNEDDIIDFLRGDVDFIPEKQELFYIHLAHGENGYVNIDKESGDLALENKKDTTYWKTEFTKEEVIQMNPSYVHFLEPVEDDKEGVEAYSQMPIDLSEEEEQAKFYVFKKGSLDRCDFYNEYISNGGYKRYCWDNTNETDTRVGKYKTKFTLQEIKQFDLTSDEILLVPAIVDGTESINPYDILEEKFYISRGNGFRDFLNLELHSDGHSFYNWNTDSQFDTFQTEFSTEDLINIDPKFLKDVKFKTVS